MLTFITRSGEDGQLRENSRLPNTIQVTDKHLKLKNIPLNFQRFSSRTVVRALSSYTKIKLTDHVFKPKTCFFLDQLCKVNGQYLV